MLEEAASTVERLRLPEVATQVAEQLVALEVTAQAVEQQPAKVAGRSSGGRGANVPEGCGALGGAGGPIGVKTLAVA